MNTFKSQQMKGQFSGVVWQIVAAVIAVLVLGLVITYGADITQDIHDDQTVDSYAYNVSADALDAQENIAEKQGTITNVIVAVAIITLLIGGFGAFAMSRR